MGDLAKSTLWLTGCHGYHTRALSLILTFWRPLKIDLTPHQSEVVRAKGSCAGRGSLTPIRQRCGEQKAKK